MDYKQITSAIKLFVTIQKWASYVSKERFDVAAKVKYNIDNEKHLDRLYGLFNSACKSLSLFAEDKLKKELEMAIRIAEFAYLGENLKWKGIPSPSHGRVDMYRKDYRRYFYKIDGSEQIEQIDINFRDPQNIVMLAELLKKPEVTFVEVVEYIDEIEDQDGKQMKYFDGDIIFVYGKVSDRLFYDWYRTDAGVYLATRRGWRKLKYVRGRGYLDKNGDPEFENESCYNNSKVNDFGRAFRYIGNLYKDNSVLVEPSEETPEK